jgi:hemoglobin-like flavoprotein
MRRYQKVPLLRYSENNVTNRQFALEASITPGVKSFNRAQRREGQQNRCLLRTQCMLAEKKPHNMWRFSDATDKTEN